MLSILRLCRANPQGPNFHVHPYRDLFRGGAQVRNLFHDVVTRWPSRGSVQFPRFCLNPLLAQRQRDARDCYAELGARVRWFTDIHYAAGSWDRKRRVIAKIEHTAKGSNPRYVVTNLKGAGKTLYDKLYCARGEMENRIKEQQLDLFADRTSCHRWWPNQFRLLLSSLAYMLLEAIRRLALKGTELANAYVGTLRLKLLKVGAVILRNTRRIRFLLSSACPYQRLFFHVAARLAPG